MALLLEEPDELNDYVNVFSPKAWHILWLKVQLLLPILLYSLLCAWEMMLFAAWSHDDKMSVTLWKLVLVTAIVSLPLPLLIVSTLRFGQRAKSRIEITPDGIKASSLKFDIVTWERLLALTINDMSGAPGLAMLLVKYTPKPATSFLQKSLVIPLGKKVPAHRRAGQLLRVALANPRQVEPLRHELQRLRDSGKPVPIIAEPRNPPVRVRWMYMGFLGFFVMQHGLPLLLIGLMPPNPSNSQATSNDQAFATKMAPIVRKHFHNKKEMEQFYIKAGAVLTGVGATMFAASFIIPARQRRAWQLNAPGEPIARAGTNT